MADHGTLNAKCRKQWVIQLAKLGGEDPGWTLEAFCNCDGFRLGLELCPGDYLVANGIVVVPKDKSANRIRWEQSGFTFSTKRYTEFDLYFERNIRLDGIHRIDFDVSGDPLAHYWTTVPVMWWNEMGVSLDLDQAHLRQGIDILGNTAAKSIGGFISRLFKSKTMQRIVTKGVKEELMGDG